MDTPLSKSNVTLKLAAIQQRCAELIDGSDEEMTELSLEEPVDTSEDQQQYCIER